MVLQIGEANGSPLNANLCSCNKAEICTGFYAVHHFKTSSPKHSLVPF